MIVINEILSRYLKDCLGGIKKIYLRALSDNISSGGLTKSLILMLSN